MPLPPPTRPHSSRAMTAGPSSGIFASPAKRTGRGGRNAGRDWDDAWDSSSDHEDHEPSNRQSSSASPTTDRRSGSSPGPSDDLNGYSQLSLEPLASSPPGPGLSSTGAWEIVESEDAEPTPEPPARSGAEAVRKDVQEVLKNPLRLLDNFTCHAASSEAESSHSNLRRNGSGSGRRTPRSAASASRSTLRELPNASASDATASKLGRQRSMRTERRRETFAKVLRGREGASAGVDIAELRRQAWSGVPAEVRPIAWQMLLNYLPLPAAPRLATLQRKRTEYAQLVEQHFGTDAGPLDAAIWHQISIDVPRTRPGVPLWSCVTAQRCLERILYIWAIRHPASGYVQGINDLATPFFQVFLGAYIDADPETFDAAFLDLEILTAIEADSFWCLAKLLDGIQDNYIFAQPGIQRLVKRMCELVRRIEPSLAAHLEDQGVEYMQFAFRWMNCLLMREMSIKCTIRMWDTYLAEGTDAFSQFHLYVCSAFLVKWSETLKAKDFQSIIMFLQNLPTQDWTDHDVALLLSEAFVLKATWHGAENHFARRVGELPGMSGGMGGR